MQLQTNVEYRRETVLLGGMAVYIVSQDGSGDSAVFDEYAIQGDVPAVPETDSPGAVFDSNTGNLNVPEADVHLGDGLIDYRFAFWMIRKCRHLSCGMLN